MMIILALSIALRNNSFKYIRWSLYKTDKQFNGSTWILFTFVFLNTDHKYCNYGSNENRHTS